MQQTTIPTLYHLSSSQSLRVLWALEELKEANGLQYKLVKYSRQTGAAPEELKSIYPLGKAPILTIEPLNNSSSNTDADTTQPKKPLKTLIESRLILLFIAENYSNGIWTPKSAESRDRDLFFQEFGNGTLRTKVDFTLIFDVIPQFSPFLIRPLLRLMFKPMVAIMSKDLPTIFNILEDALSAEQPWFAGERIGLADFNVSFGMDMADARGYFDRSKYPKLAKWHQTVQDRPAYKKAIEMGPAYDLANFT